MVDFNVREAVKLLVNDEYVLNNKSKLADALAIPVETLHVLNTKLLSGTLEIREYFQRVLQDWLGRGDGSFALRKLCEVLESEGFRNVAEKMCEINKPVKMNHTQDIPFVFGVKPPSTDFVGRREELQQLHNFLFSACQTLVVISGMGGSGKTQLCRKYVQEMRSSRTDVATTWMVFDGFESFRSFLHHLNEELSLGQYDPSVRPYTTDQMITSIAQHFAAICKTWLVVLDNVDDNSAELNTVVYQLTSASAKVLVTTRRADILSHTKCRLTLQPLADEDALILVQSGLGHEVTTNDAGLLCAELGNHALGLQHAVGYINAERSEGDSSYSVTHFIREKRGSASHICQAFENEGQILGYEWTVFTLVGHDIENIRTKHGLKGQGALKILQILSHIHPDGIDTDFLNLLYASTYDEQDSSNVLPLLQCLRLIKLYSLVDIANQRIMVHRLVQYAVRHQTSCKETMEMLLLNIQESIPIMTQEQLPHVVSIWKHFVKKNELAVLLYPTIPVKIFKAMFTLALFENLTSFAEESYTQLLKAYGANHRLTLQMENCIARGLKENGEFENALHKFLEVYEKRKQAFPLKDRDPHTLTTSHFIATMLFCLKRYDESLVWFTDVLSKKEEELGENDVSTLVTRNNMALLLKDKGDYEAARQLLMKNLPKLKQYLGESETNTLACRHNFACCLFEEGRYAEALGELQEVVKLRKSILGERNNFTLFSQHYLACCLWELNERDKALKVMKAVLSSREEVLGKNHPHTLESKGLVQNWEMLI